MSKAEIVYEVIKQRRSVRSYVEDPPPRKLLERLVEVGQWAPSPSNVQSWRFIIVHESGQLSALKNLSPGFPRQATAAIVICSDDHDTQRFSGQMRAGLVAEEAAMAAQNMLLMAHAMDYGSCPVASFSRAGITTLIGLPEHIHPVLIIALGTPDCQPSAPVRRPPAEITHWEDYQEV
ncbi:MAG: nitroreductase family protein [Candidatus Bipolaricaulota bacterium]|nr:nitroreductase family protein [Candidatus Bipolaricaulota bacterium]